MTKPKTLKDFVEEYCSGPPELVPDDRRPRKELLEDFEKDLRAWAIEIIHELEKDYSEDSYKPNFKPQTNREYWLLTENRQRWMDKFNLMEKDLK